jgi:hypothetical protein
MPEPYRDATHCTKALSSSVAPEPKLSPLTTEKKISGRWSAAQTAVRRAR